MPGDRLGIVLEIIGVSYGILLGFCFLLGQEGRFRCVSGWFGGCLGLFLGLLEGDKSNCEMLADARYSEDASACSKRCQWIIFFIVLALPLLCLCVCGGDCFGVVWGLFKDSGGWLFRG